MENLNTMNIKTIEAYYQYHVGQIEQLRNLVIPTFDKIGRELALRGFKVTVKTERGAYADEHPIFKVEPHNEDVLREISEAYKVAQELGVKIQDKTF